MLFPFPLKFIRVVGLLGFCFLWAFFSRVAGCFCMLGLLLMVFWGFPWGSVREIFLGAPYELGFLQVKQKKAKVEKQIKGKCKLCNSGRKMCVRD
jgi:hypothetical protein